MTSSDMSGRPSRSLLSQSEDYISSVSLQEKSLNYISLLNNYNMAPQVSPVDSSVASNADSQHEYIHDPIDDAPSVSKYAPDLPVQTVDENVIHMEITKLPIEPATPAPGNQPVNINVSANTADILSEDTVRRRSIKMDIGDEL